MLLDFVRPSAGPRRTRPMSWRFSRMPRKRIGYLVAGAVATLIGAFFVVPSASAATTVYTMSAFSNSNETDMYTYQSTDGLKFNRIGTGKVYTPPAGILRDPSIIKNTNDRRYYVAYTNAWHSNSIGLASSADLKKWTFIKNLTFATTIDTSWAPEWFKDTNGSYNLIVHLRTKGKLGPSPYLITATNGALTNWTAPVALDGLQATSSANYIDSDVIKIGSTYHIFVKNDANKLIEHATSTKLAGPYTFVNRGDWAKWGPNREGPNLYQLDNGTWRILLDGYKDNSYWYSDSKDLKTWTTKQKLPNGLSGFVRHVTVLKERL
jgi:hypothetical protein